MMGTRYLAGLSLVAGLAACGDDGNKGATETTPETTQETTQETTTPNETVQETTPQETAQETQQETAQETQQETQQETVTPTCDTNTAITGEPFMEYIVDFDFTVFGVGNEELELALEFYDLDGSGSPLTGPGDYALNDGAGEDNYATCGICGVIRTAEGTKYFATSGTIRVTAIDQDTRTISASLEDAVFEEATIDEDSEEPTFESTIVPNGEVWCLPTLQIDAEPECTQDSDCEGATPICDTEIFACVGCIEDADCSGATPFCVALEAGNTCAECGSDFDCSAATPVCGLEADGVTVGCLAGNDVCTGDDALEPNDGFLGASPLTVGTPLDAKICGNNGEESGFEADWYTFTLAAETNLQLSLTWAETDVDLDFYFVSIVDGEFQLMADGGATIDGNPIPETAQAVNLAAGTYYVLVNSYAGTDAAIDYTLSIVTFEPECTEDADCTEAGTPACDPDTLTCIVCMSDIHCPAENPVCLNDFGVEAPNSCGVVDACTGDDAAENGDDGQNGATVLTLPAEPVAAKICGEGGAPSEFEYDYYKVTLSAGNTVTVSVAYETAGLDLDVFLESRTELLVSGVTAASPEVVTYDVTEDGDYWIRIQSFEGAASAAVDYTLTVTTAPTP